MPNCSDTKKLNTYRTGWKIMEPCCWSTNLSVNFDAFVVDRLCYITWIWVLEQCHHSYNNLIPWVQVLWQQHDSSATHHKYYCKSIPSPLSSYLQLQIVSLTSASGSSSFYFLCSLHVNASHVMPSSGLWKVWPIPSLQQTSCSTQVFDNFALCISETVHCRWLPATGFP